MIDFFLPSIEIDLECAYQAPGIFLAPIFLLSETNLPDMEFLWEGMKKEKVQVSEREGKCIIERIVVNNPTDKKFFAYRGSIIRGGGQNRQMSQGVVIPKKQMEIPVQCIQKGRWNPEQKKDFYAKSGESTISSLRFSRFSQRQVWQTIHKTTCGTGTVNDTQDYTEVQDKIVSASITKYRTSSTQDSGTLHGEESPILSTQNTITEVLKNFTLYPGQVGLFVIEIQGGAPKYFIEIFGSSDLYMKVHDYIVASFALNINRNVTAVPHFSQEDFQQLWRSIPECDWKKSERFGEEKGQHLHEANNAFGEFVILDDSFLHLMYSSNTLEPSTTKTLGEFYVLEKIGVGGMSNVFRAKTEDDTEVALKVVRKSNAAVKRLQREYEVMKKLAHLHIVDIISMGETENCTYLALEYIQGLNLEERIQRQEISEKNALKWAYWIALALDHALQRGVIHRDLKPENIFFTDKGILRVGDWGLGKADTSSEMTLSGEFMGTPYYSSPEQVRDAKSVNHLSDIYALGAILYHLVVKKPPYFEYKGTINILRAKANGDPPKPTEVDSNISKCVEEVIEQMMHRDPAKRPQSPKEVLKKLDKALDLISLKKNVDDINETWQDFFLYRKWQETGYIAEQNDEIIFLRQLQIENLKDEFFSEIAWFKTLSHDRILSLLEHRVCRDKEYYILKQKYMPLLSFYGGGDIWTNLILTIHILSNLEHLHSFGIKVIALSLQDIFYDIPSCGFAINPITNELLFQYLKDAPDIQNDRKRLLLVAPEVIWDSKKVDKQSDIYNVGVILYYLLADKLPYCNFETCQLAEAKRTEKPKSLENYLGEKHPRLFEIVEKAIAIEPKDRYSSADEFRSALRDVIGIYDKGQG